MGYRSEVAIAVCDEKKDELVKLLVKHDFLKDGEVQDNAHDNIVYYADYIKWYSIDDGVKAVTEHLFTLEDEDYGFLRIGEDGDIEYMGEPYSHGINYKCEITFD